MRQGKAPRGIVAAGFSVDEPEPTNDPDDHSNYGEFVFTMVLDPDKDEILEVESMKADTALKDVLWGIQCGGREFTDDEAQQLELLWANLLSRLGKQELNAFEAEG